MIFQVGALNITAVYLSVKHFVNPYLNLVFLSNCLTSYISQIELEWDWVILKNRTHVGRVKPHMIRTYKKPVIQELEKTESNKRSAKKSSKPTQPAPKPDYIVLQVGSFFSVL